MVNVHLDTLMESTGKIFCGVITHSEDSPQLPSSDHEDDGKLVIF